VTTTLNKMGTAAGWMMASRVVRFALGLGSSVVVVRGLGDHDYGVLSVARTVTMIALLLCGAGASKAILKFLPLVRVRGSAADARKLAIGSIAAVMALWLAASLGVLSARGALAGAFPTPGMGRILAVAVGLAAFELLFTVISQFLYAALEVRRQAVAAVVTHAAYFAAVIVVVRAGAGVVGVIIAGAIGFATGTLVLLPGLSAALRVDAQKENPERLTSVRLLRYAAPVTAMALLNMVVWRQSETLFLAHFRGPVATAYFDLAYRVPQMILEFIPGTLWPLVMAGLATVHARDTGAVVHAVERYYRALFLLSAPLCVAGIAFGGRAIPLLYSSQMAPAAIPAQIFFAVFTISFFSNPLSIALLVLEKPMVNLLIYGLLTVINVGLDLVLIPRFGLPGAIVPVAVAMLVSPFVYYAAVRRQGMRVRIPGRFIIRCFVASVPVLALGPLAGIARGPVPLAGAVALSVPVLLVSFRLMRVVGPGERELFASVPLPAMNRLLKFVCP